MVENKFWVVKSVFETDEYEMFNSIPYYNEIGVLKYWWAAHGHCYLGRQSYDKFADVTRDSEPVPVRLVLPEESQTLCENPDFYIQRWGDNLFINNHLEKYCCPVRRKFLGWKYTYEERVPHIYRISNKLFSEITEAVGPVKFNIERI